jgi:DNA mismatch endonuclease (patch repair protein)
MDTVSPEQRSHNMSRVRGKNTGLELKVRSLLHGLGYRYRLHRKDLPGTPDIVFSGRRSVIFIHGCFWHGHSCARAALPTNNRQFWETKIGRNTERDCRTLDRLQDAGWNVLTVWQCETRDETALRTRLVDFLGAGTMRDEASG